MRPLVPGDHILRASNRYTGEYEYRIPIWFRDGSSVGFYPSAFRYRGDEEWTPVEPRPMRSEPDGWTIFTVVGEDPSGHPLVVADEGTFDEKFVPRKL